MHEKLVLECHVTKECVMSEGIRHNEDTVMALKKKRNLSMTYKTVRISLLD